MEFVSELHSQMQHPERYEKLKHAFYDPDHILNKNMPGTGSLGDYIRHGDKLSEIMWTLYLNDFNVPTMVLEMILDGTPKPGTISLIDSMPDIEDRIDAKKQWLASLERKLNE